MSTNISFLHTCTQCIIGTEIFPPLWEVPDFFHTGVSKETICDFTEIFPMNGAALKLKYIHL